MKGGLKEMPDSPKSINVRAVGARIVKEKKKGMFYSSFFLIWLGSIVSSRVWMDWDGGSCAIAIAGGAIALFGAYLNQHSVKSVSR